MGGLLAMTAKEIHDNLLSLFIRGLGVWLLYLALSTENFISFWDTLYRHFTPGADTTVDWEALFIIFVHLLVAAYFILGAPPFLKAATRDKASNG